MADQRAPLLQRLPDFFGAQGGADDLRFVRVDLQGLAVGIDNQHGVEGMVFGLQALGFFPEQLRIIEVAAQYLAAVAQAAMRRLEKLANAGSHLGGIGLIGLQRRMHQRIALHTVGHPQAVAQRGHDRQQHKQQNQAAQANG
ncbi:hypothetical protein D3C77_259940 [compost metagenome]